MRLAVEVEKADKVEGIELLGGEEVCVLGGGE